MDQKQAQQVAQQMQQAAQDAAQVPDVYLQQWRAAENRSDLVILEAQDIAKGPIAVAEVPRRVPFGFHGLWVDEADL